MICQCCNDQSAVIERGKGPHKLQLCMDCVSASGLHHLDGWKLTIHSASECRCPTCYQSWAEFSRVVRYGCPDCQRTFKPLLDPILERIKAPGNIPDHPQSQDLQEVELNLALLIEDYELAARIRDEMDHDS